MPPEDWKRLSIQDIEIVPNGNSNETRVLERIAQRSRIMDKYQRNSDFWKIVNKYDQFQFASQYTGLLSELGLQKMPHNKFKMIQELSGPSNSAIEDRNNNGKIWMRICGGLEHGSGLLPFIPCVAVNLSPFEVTTTSYTGLVEKGSDKRLKSFHQLLQHDYVQSLCKIGQDWFDAVDCGKEFLDDVDELGVEWDTLSEEEVMEYLEWLVKTK
ncbi:hypothetical protein NW762_012923 [Fusarium torreyae]|uniref:Uncharacterized protein n=1 Tax=Fusarium torreyae TaxID=1237075 RepID=A0A9W8VB15_9HYPO|nr:hypothetical protein NW762_012923 [Fusarium torreyae]